MYLIAETYEPNSEEFNNVFDIAVRMFPDDPIANLNASAIAINNGNIKNAEKYLSKIDNVNAEYLNNKGVLAYETGDIDEAIKYFTESANLGCEAAVFNLSMIQVK